MVDQALFTSDSSEWETPADLFDRWNEKYHFELDVCAQPHNAKCKEYFTPEIDGLRQDWGNKVCWMNPPYGKTIAEWIRKAYQSAQKGATVVCLLPSRTDTKWFHNYCIHGRLFFIKGRLRFVGGHSCAPFPSIIVIFEPPKNKE